MNFVFYCATCGRQGSISFRAPRPDELCDKCMSMMFDGDFEKESE